MTPKEKAQNLFEMFYDIIFVDGGKNYRIRAKQCALMLVDEILKSGPTQPMAFNWHECLDDRVEENNEYWEEVKRELEKL